jgi:signal transduction histidine kinase
MSPAVILNVDDNAPNRYARNRVLVNAGFIAIDAATGQETLDMAILHEPDLVLLDINLPDIDGIEICRRLKSRPEYSSTLILQISASATTAPHATAALNSGADAYLAEPVDSAVLVATIHALLRLRQAERELKEANAALHQANHSLAGVNKDLRQSNLDLQQFAYFASHDLQEPLRQVINFVQLLSQSTTGRFTAEERKYLGFVEEGADRMQHLIRALLSYSQIGHGDGPAHSKVELNSVVDRVIHELSERIQEAGGQITRGELPVVIGDSVQLADVIQNLFINSIKYRRTNEPLHVKVDAIRENDGEATISIRDNGQGIDPRYHDLIFLPFKRLHGREIPGTGIGLAICRRIIEAHGGRIWLESAKGCGTTFHFSLPTL